MKFYARVINLITDWDMGKSNVNNLNFDVINDLKSNNNTLSFWLLNSLDDLYQMALAYLFSLRQLKNFSIIAIPENTFNEISIPNKTPDNTTTLYLKCKQNHCDLESLTVKDVVPVIKCIHNALKHAENHDAFYYDFQFNDEVAKIKEIIDKGEVDTAIIKTTKNFNNFYNELKKLRVID
jgi:hypothetical protein